MDIDNLIRSGKLEDVYGSNPAIITYQKERIERSVKGYEEHFGKCEDLHIFSAAGRSEIGKNGVVRDAAVHERVIRDIVAFSESIGFTVQGLSFSPITGPKGNVEFLLYIFKGCTKNVAEMHNLTELISEIVEKAHLLGKSC